MDKELVINSMPSGVEIAFLENKQLVEYHSENNADSFSVGDVILGRVKKVMPGLNACFVDVGYKKDAFLHYTDLGVNFISFRDHFKQALAGNKDSLLKNIKTFKGIPKDGNIKSVIKPKQLLPVQVFKEPISSKGPRLTTDFSIAGRFLILMPFTNTIGVSKNIGNDEERKRLKILIESLKPNNFGVIVRTAAKNKKSSELHQDLNNLVEKWKELHLNLKGASPKQKLLSEEDKSLSLVRDILDKDFTSITTNNTSLENALKNYIKSVSPGREKIVQQYKGKNPIFDNFGITKQIKSSFGKTVTFAKGPYLVIEHTEAMHVIDVNSGHKIGMKGSQEDNALTVNKGAAKEVARQLRLRDIGGIIVVDFIDMRDRENKKAIYDLVKEELKKDKATSSVLPLSKFNVMQITRQRVRPQVEIKTQESCPSCKGTGKIQASVLLIPKIKHKLSTVLKTKKPFTLEVHPFIYSHLTKGLFSTVRQWMWEYKTLIKIIPNQDFAFTQYQFTDNDNNIIEV